MVLRLHNALILSIFLLAGCEDHSAWTIPDVWYTSQQTKISGASWPDKSYKLSDDLYCEVVDVYENEAEKLLEKVSSVEISMEQFSRYVATKPPIPAGRKPFLVRGVYLNVSGSFFIFFKDDMLFVNHGCMGRHAVPMKRQCLVVLLEKAPRQVYISCDMVE
jgi:hypothetical protein